MGIDLYHALESPPSMAVRLTAKAIGVNLNLIPVNLLKQEHLTPEYKKINPQQMVPFMIDEEFSLGESRAIQIYLVQTYGKHTDLYPTDPKAQAVVNQRLFFDIGTLYERIENYYYAMLLGAPHDQARFEKLLKALAILNTYLEGQTYVDGKNLTIADHSLLIAASVIEFSKLVNLLTDYPNIWRWLNHLKKTILGYDEIVEEGFVTFQKFLDEFKPA